MKIKLINKMQDGGGMPPFVYYQPIPDAPRSQSQIPTPTSAVTAADPTSAKAAKDASDDKGQLTDKDLMTMLKDVDGLPTDMQGIMGSLQQFYQMQDLFGDSLVNNPFNSGNQQNKLIQRYLSTLNLVKQAKFSKAQYDAAYKNVNDNKGLSEIAITDTGRVVVDKGNGNIDMVSVDQFINQRDKLKPITNSNLLWLRANDPRFAHNDKIYSVVENGIGMEKVTDLIKSAIDGAGKDDSTLEGYSVKSNGEIIAGLQLLQDAQNKGYDVKDEQGMDGIYKNSIHSESQKKQINAALEYLYKMLPENARTLLAVKSGNKDSRAGVFDLISKIAISKSSETYSFSTDYQKPDEDSDGSGSGKSKSGKDVDYEMTNPDLFVKGFGNQESIEMYSKGNTAMRMMVNSMPITTKEGNTISDKSLNTIANESEYGGALDISKASIGGMHIDPNSVKVNGNRMYNVMLPLNSNGEPDMQSIVKVEAVNNALRQQGIEPNKPQPNQIQAINTAYKNAGVNIELTPDGRPVVGKCASFAAFNATASINSNTGDQLNEAVKNQYIQRIDDNSQAAKSAMQVLKGDKEHPTGFEYDEDNFYDFNGHDNFYNGLVLVPIIREESSIRATTSGKQPTVRQMMASQQHASGMGQPSTAYVRPPQL